MVAQACTVKEILAIDPAAVIFTMSGQDSDYQETARMLGARRGFEKPVSFKDLLNAVAHESDSKGEMHESER